MKQAKEKEKISEKIDYEKYWNTVDENGNRYEIPMLMFMDPNYKMKYIEYMMLREKNPAEFERILNWN